MSLGRSLGIVTLTRGAVFVLSFATVVIVSRLLTPEEIGIFSVSVALVSLAHVFRDFGVGQYLIQVKEVTRRRRRAAFTVTLVFSWTIALLLLLLHPWIGRLYKDARVGDVVLLLVVSFLTLPFGAPVRTLMQRDMLFGKLAVVNLSNQLVQSGTTLAAAWAGAAHMSMAWGSIAGNVANVVILLVISPKGALDWPTRHGLREVLGFGWKFSTATLAKSAGGSAPDLILGRTLGFADVAFYSRARGLISMALDQLMYVVRSVYAPAFAKGFREGRNPAELYMQTASLLLGLTLPVIALLAVLAPQLIVWLFGPQWLRSAPLGTMFCLFALVTAPFSLATISLVASGHVGLLMRTRLVIEATRIGVLLSSMFLTLETVVALSGLVYVVESIVLMGALKSSLGLTARAMGSCIWRSYALLPFVLMGPGLALVGSSLIHPLPSIVILALSTVLALLGWFVGLTVLRHPLRKEVLDVGRLLGARARALLGRQRR